MGTFNDNNISTLLWKKRLASPTRWGKTSSLLKPSAPCATFRALSQFPYPTPPATRAVDVIPISLPCAPFGRDPKPFYSPQWRSPFISPTVLIGTTVSERIPKCGGLLIKLINFEYVTFCFDLSPFWTSTEALGLVSNAQVCKSVRGEVYWQLC